MRKHHETGTVGKVTWLGLIANVILAVFKFLAGIFGNSAAMVADAVHSLSDVGSDIVVLIGLRIAAEPEDDSHPYGHGKVETSATVLVGAILIAAGGLIFWEGFLGIYQDIHKQPGWLALAAAAVSIVVKEVLYRVTLHAGRREKKPSVVANAWHHRSDALSSVAALVGVGGEMLGVMHLDCLAAMAVALFVVRTGLVIAWDAYKDLIDTAVGVRLQRKIAELVDDTPGVLAHHKLRTRKVGAAIFVDLHIEVDESLNIRAAHDIADRVEHALIEILEVDDVTVHIDVHD